MKTIEEKGDSKLPIKQKSNDQMLQNLVSKDLIKRIENQADKKDTNFMKVFKSILKNSD